MQAADFMGDDALVMEVAQLYADELASAEVPHQSAQMPSSCEAIEVHARSLLTRSSACACHPPVMQLAFISSVVGCKRG